MTTKKDEAKTALHLLKFSYTFVVKCDIIMKYENKEVDNTHCFTTEIYGKLIEV
jgi:hypothetical protein